MLSCLSLPSLSVHSSCITPTVSMQFLCIVSVLSTLLSMGLLVVIVGQNPTFHMENSQIENQQIKLNGLKAQQINREAFRMKLEKLVVQATEVASELEAAVAKLGAELGKRKAESDACEAQKV